MFPVSSNYLLSQTTAVKSLYRSRSNSRNVLSFQKQKQQSMDTTTYSFRPCIRGYHDYKDTCIWDAIVGEVLYCEVKVKFFFVILYFLILANRNVLQKE